ncbi:hypothetical protein F4805DRAFT_368418 [Annulohypoxylon moriforme]|nr:hypothetical protein F4805DRAFT_368418 [Annulohypoxylon moriforme]
MNGSGTPNRSRLTPNPPGAHDDSSYNAALKGASLAFQKSTSKKAPVPLPSPRPTSRNIDNGALIAATSAASASRDHSRTVSRQTTGGSVQDRNDDIGTDQRAASRSSVHNLQPPSQRGLTTSHLGTPNKQATPDPRSPSFIAATLAASRSGSPVRHHMSQSQSTSQQIRRQRKHSVGTDNSAASSVTSLDLATDTTSIPSTNALISMFEKRDDIDPIKKDNTKSDDRKPFGVKSTSRTLSPSRAMDPIVKNELSPSRLASTKAWERASSPSSSVVDVVREKPRQSQNVAVEAKARPPAPPPARTKNTVQASIQPNALESKGKPRATSPPPKSISRVETAILSPQPRRNTSKQIILDDIRAQDSVSKGITPPPTKPKPKTPASVHVITKPALPDNDLRRISTSSNDTFVSASEAPSPPSDSPQRGMSQPPTPDTVRPMRLTRPPSSQTISTISIERPPALPPRQSRPASTLPLESLTDAIMAGSLASSRITPSKTPPPKPPSRRQTPHMRQTLRQATSQSDDEEKRRKARKVGGKNKHSHHEGARKRWREEITARERKRYEGVWASNRGLHLVSPEGSRASSTNGQSQSHAQAEDDREQGVANVVVRDLWTRSRLPIDELAEVWDLVDRRGKGYLDRAEFVVGMWLVDQRLRGRKIPRKVTESVWGSARGVRVAGVGGKKK